MKIEGDGQRLRIYCGETDRHEGHPLAEAIVRLARERGLAGATVFRGAMGYGANSLIHTTKVLRLSESLPTVVEIIDREDRIQSFMETEEERRRIKLETDRADLLTRPSG